MAEGTNNSTQVPFPDQMPEKSGPEQAEAWPKWLRRFERFSAATKLHEKEQKEQVQTLFYAFGPAVDDILVTLDLDEDKCTYAEATKALDTYFGVRKNSIVCRARFNRRVQQQGEPVEVFIQDLYRLANDCEYGTMKDTLICDRIVVGVLDETLSDRMQLNKKLTLNDAVEMARQAEARKNNRDVVRGQASTSTSSSTAVDYVKKQFKSKDKHSHSKGGAHNSNAKRWSKEQSKNVTQQSQPKDSSKTCPWCGNSPHFRRFCPAKDAVCVLCKKKGHFQSVCRKKNTGVHTVELSDDEYPFLGTIGDDADWTEKVDVNGQEVTFKLDTGASVSVLSDSVPWLSSVQNDIQACSQVLKGPGGIPLSVIGKLEAQLSVGSKSTQETLYLLNNQSISLLSRNACSQLGLVVRNRPTLHEVQKVPNFQDEFPELFTGLGKLQESHAIKIDPSVTPTCLFTPRRVPHPLWSKVRDELNRMQELGVISPVEEPTTWCSGLVPVVKPNGKIRICVDLTGLNRAVQREIYPMKSVQENLAKLANAKYFKKLDANSGFWQIPLDKESQLLTTFITPFGRFAFNRLPFGITSAPEIFQRTMSKILIDTEGVVCHMDDVLIHGNTRQQHDDRVRVVLQKLKAAGLTLNEKCEFGKTTMTFLGHIISADGIKADPRKVEAVRKFPTPENVRDMQRFQGMVNQLAKFVPGLAEINAPLRQLLCKDVEFVWGASQEASFNKIKEMLLSDIVLTHYDVTKPTIVAADAAKSGIGAVLLQVQEDGNRRPVCFASRSLTETEQRYAVIEKEALAATWACEQFRDYVLGLPFLLETDHKPLVPILGSKDLANMPLRIQRFKMRLMVYNYTIKYVTGKLQVIADALSRAPIQTLNINSIKAANEIESHTGALHFELVASSTKLQEIMQNQQDDVVLSEIRSYCINGWPGYLPHNPILHPYWEARSHLNIVNNILLFDDRIVIPQNMRLSVLDSIHQGHLGITKCRARARQAVWWPGLSVQIQQMVSKCMVCAKLQPTPRETLMPSSIPKRPWERVAMDLCYYDNATYIVVVDYLSRWVEFRRLVSETTKGTINALKSIFSVHGIPDVAVSDNGPQFASSEFKSFTNSYGFTHVTSSPKFPQSNGEAERAVKTFKELWKKNDDPYLALLIYRSTPLANGLTPSEILMGRKLKTPLPILPQKLMPAVTKDKLESAVQKDESNRMKQKQWYDNRYRAKDLPVLQPGDSVWIRDQNRDGIVVQKHANPRSYVVQTDEGTVRRNRSALQSCDQDSENVGVPQSPRNVNSPSPRNVNSSSPRRQMTTPRSAEVPKRPTTRMQAGKTIVAPKRLDI